MAHLRHHGIGRWNEFLRVERSTRKCLRQSNAREDRCRVTGRDCPISAKSLHARSPVCSRRTDADEVVSKHRARTCTLVSCGRQPSATRPSEVREGAEPTPFRQ